MKRHIVDENNISTSIIDCLRRLNFGVFWRQNNIPVFDRATGSFRSLSSYHRKGVSDILGVTRTGLFVAIEVKTSETFTHVQKLMTQFDNPYNAISSDKTKKHYIEQWRFIFDIKTNGGIAFFTYSLSHTLYSLKLSDTVDDSEQGELFQCNKMRR